MGNKTLDKASKGKFLKINSLPKGIHRIQLLRFGITEGDIVFCLERLPGGTVVIKKNRQEIAIGFDIAKNISCSYHS
ncbi:MAG: ferrous iron transport protein A [Ignavibacteriaceae bacterium]|nr:ferrous iron transport protein A [Ignavibacteriaceae bacterium]